MRINTKFPVAVHMLALVALNQNKERPSTSELMAHSVGTNPVVIRRIMVQLKAAGLMSSQTGVPGASLMKRPEEITLLAVWQAIQDKEDTTVFDLHAHPCPDCLVGRNICCALADPLAKAQEAMERTLAEYTLANIVGDIADKIARCECEQGRK